MLIACICLFVSASCIYAADTDGTSPINQSSVTLNDEGISSNAALDESPNPDTCNMSKISTDPIIINHKYPHHTNKTNFSHEKHEKDFHMKNNTDFHINPHSKIHNHEDNEIFHHRIHKKHMESGHSHDCSQKHHHNGIEKINATTVIADSPCLNNACSFGSASTHDKKLTKESDFCWCGKEHCGHELHEGIHHHEIIIGDHVSENFADTYNYYIQIETAGNAVVKSSDKDEEEKMNHNFNYVSAFNYTQNANQTKDKNVLGSFDAHSNIDFDNDLTNLTCEFFTQFDCITFDIDTLHCEDLDIKDYNLEYYMFSNLDIIIGKTNVFRLPKTSTLNFNNTKNHCPETIDAYESLPVDSITEDNYVSSNTTNFYKKTFSLKFWRI